MTLKTCIHLQLSATCTITDSRVPRHRLCCTPWVLPIGTRLGRPGTQDKPVPASPLPLDIQWQSESSADFPTDLSGGKPVRL